MALVESESSISFEFEVEGTYVGSGDVVRTGITRACAILMRLRRRFVSS